MSQNESPLSGKRRPSTLVPAALQLALIVGTGSVLLAGAFVWQTIRLRQRHVGMCVENVRQIVLARQHSHDTNGVFPPAYLADESGSPMHSWRVLLLPYLGQKALYDKYLFGEPWDGPHNKLLQSQTPQVYQCPADRERASA